MDIRHLKIFIAVVENGNSSAAARQLYLTQPTVSQAISEFEHYCGATLFHRSNQGLTLNKKGEELYQPAKAVVKQFQLFEEQVKNTEANAGFTVGFSLGLDYLLKPAIKQFHESYASTKVNLISGNSAQIADSLRQGSIDFGIFAGAENAQNLMTKTLWKDEYAFFCAPNHPFALQKDISFQQIMSQPIVLREKGHSSRKYFDELCHAHQKTIMPIWVSENDQIIIDRVNRYGELAFLAIGSMSEEILQNIIVPLPAIGCTAPYFIFLAYAHNRHLSQGEKHFVKTCQAIAYQLVKTEYFNCLKPDRISKNK